MLGENALRRSDAPISSVMEWNSSRKISSSTGSAIDEATIIEARELTKFLTLAKIEHNILW
jgi:hypothetical protein